MREDIIEIICRRRRQTLVHSYLYYRKNTNIISDHTFDAWTKELADLQERFPEEAAAAVYAKEFEGFDGSSGYDLPTHYPNVMNTAEHLLRIHRERTKA